MAARGGISGLAVTLAAAGGYLVYAGIRNVPLVEGLRELATGRLPQGRPVAPTVVSFLRAGQVAPDTGAKAAAGAYKLGPVKPHVADAAREIGGRFGIRTVYGWAPGLYDHPKGLALDFMVYADRAKGDQLASWVLANAGRLRITYVIWYRRIWSVARAAEGWRPYFGISSHTDHVHTSFEAI